MQFAPLRLRCEYLDNPLGIDELRPRLSWWVNDSRPAEIQSAYQIIAASRLDLLALDEGDFWDSGRVASQQTHNVEYLGKPLISGRRVYWKVRTYDSDGMPSEWSDGAHFEMGLLAEEDWRGCWIGASLVGSRASSVPVPALRRNFELSSVPISARLHISALGHYRAEINGIRVGDGELTPGWTDYDTRVEYQSYDVTAYLQEGENVLGVLLADGWYTGQTGRGGRQQYGRQPLVCAQLNMTMASGAMLIIGTDALWRWRPSWILAADPVSGESVDARLFDPGWSKVSEIGEDWFSVVLSDVSPLRVATRAPLVKSVVEVPASLIDSSDVELYEMPGQLLGRVRLQLNVSEGALIRVRYGEKLSADGRLLAPVSEDVYTARGHGPEETFEPVFSLHGFRYVEISGDIFRQDAVKVTGVALRQDIAVTGEFACDHPRLNDLQAELTDSLRQTCQGIPLAGFNPAMRMGGTGEAFANLPSSIINFEVAALYSKWLRDLEDAQLADGALPEVVPTPPGLEHLSRDSGAPHSDVFVECVWRLYRHYGDRRVLERYFPAIKRFFTGLALKYPDYIRHSEFRLEFPAVPNDLLATAWYYHSAHLAARIAGVLGNLSDLEKFNALAVSIRNAFRRRFVTPDGRVVSDSAEAYVLVLAFGLLEAAQYHTAVPELLRHIEADEPISATVELLDTLVQLGRVDLAYRVLLRAAEDGGGSSTGKQIVGQGIGEWLYTAAAGMTLDRDLADRHNAFRRMRIQPRPPLGKGFAEGPPLRAVTAALETMNGRFELNWRINDYGFELSVHIPCNCTAEVIMPDDTKHEVVAGEYEFAMPFSEGGDGIPILREVAQAS